MCPACLTIAAFMTAGVTSAGGLAAYSLKKRRQKNSSQHPMKNKKSLGDCNEKTTAYIQF